MNDKLKLLEPLSLGELKLANRIFMAPLTRCRASAGRVPNTMMRDYYVQRASAGLILSEATSVTAMGVGYPNTPGIWSPEQTAGWKQITTAVHEAGGKMFLQLWHVGRVSDPSYLDGALPVAPSAIAPKGHVSLIRPHKSFVTPRALERSEIPGVIEAYRQGAANALRRVSMAWRFTARTVICSINSFRTARTNARTITAGRLKIARGSCSK
jgi:2,4-dienoyl-CoA reductase-like NADH-dependent reductase (Old Yellow Enzyme family)